MDLWLKTGSITKKKTEFQNNNQDSTGLKEQRNDANSATQLKLLEAGADAMDEGNSADTNQSSTDASVTTVGHKQTHQETAKKKRKYCSDYLKLGFFWQGNSEDPIPQCVLCYETLANEAMKPSKLRRHFESRHKEYVGKPIEFFQRKCNELDIHRRKEASSFFIPGENAKATESSYKVSLLIAKTGKAHSIGETLVKPAAKIMTEIMLGEKASKEINKIPLSNDTVKKKITSMAENVKVQLVSQLQQSLYFSLQLDESTDIGNEANLLCFVRYIYCGEVHDEFLFCRPLPTNTTGEAIFNVADDFIVQNKLSWSRCVGISTDGATAMTGKLRGLVSRVQSIVPQVKATHCCIHREQLAVKHMPTCLKTVLEEAVKIVNFIKGKALNTRLFTALCEEMGSEHTKLLYHTEIRWLTRGKVLSRLFELREEVQIFLYERHDLYNRMHDTQWLTKLAYLSDIFSTLNGLNLSLQGKDTTIFKVQDKIQATRMKLDLWCGRIDRKDFESFPSLADFLLTSKEELDGDTTQAFKAHLQGLHSELGKYFEEPDPSFEWIRNPFVTDKVNIEKVSVNLSSKEADNLVEIATSGTLKTLFRERSLANFWAQVQPEYPGLAEIALKHLMPFPTTYNCEIGFSTLVDLKTKKRNRINVEPDMRLKLSRLEPDIPRVMRQQKQYHSSH